MLDSHMGLQTGLCSTSANGLCTQSLRVLYTEFEGLALPDYILVDSGNTGWRRVTQTLRTLLARLHFVDSGNTGSEDVVLLVHVVRLSLSTAVWLDDTW